ncbi:MAG: hypothetical protein WAS21_01735 [Geminicoccaceae bacterium]
MGGLGSGGWNRSGRDTVDEHHSLSVGRLRRSGVFADGWCGRWHWLHDGQRIAVVLIVGGRQEIRLTYRVQCGQGDRQRIDDTILLHWRPCPFGGERPFLLCPGCARPVLQLHLAVCRFRCRRCQQLTYASQRERDYHRTLRRVRRLRQRLGQSTETGGSIPPRPKRMHRRTYATLVDRIEALKAAANDEAALLFIRVVDRLQRHSPRSFWS